MTVLATRLKIAPVAISIFSTPGIPSARVGPRFSNRTGFFNSRAYLSNLGERMFCQLGWIQSSLDQLAEMQNRLPASYP